MDCIVTATASYQSRQAIRRAIRENPQAIIAVVGCYGQVFPDELSKINGVDLIVGNKGKSSLPELLVNAIHHNPPLILKEDFEASEPFEEIPVKSFSKEQGLFENTGWMPILLYLLYCAYGPWPLEKS